MIDQNNNTPDNTGTNSNKKKSIKLILLSIVAILILTTAGYYGYMFASTPAHLRNPEIAHHHARMQIIVDGKSIDFSDKKFQQEYEKGICNAELTTEPIHFHDKQDQLLHVHWKDMTGGEFLKYYGWNMTGGDNQSLGYRFDQGLKFPQIAIAGNLLPEPKQNTNYYVYSGDETNYEKKDWDSFLDQDLEQFTGKQSLLSSSTEPFSLFDLFSSTASAADTKNDQEDKDKLEKINNLIGNVVIFAQSEEPTDTEVRERFDNLVPLSESMCGG